MLGLAEGFEVVRKTQDEEAAAADGNDAADAGVDSDPAPDASVDSAAADAEVLKRVKRKNMSTESGGSKRNQKRPSLAPEYREVTNEKLAIAKGVGEGEKEQTHKRQETNLGRDLLDTSDEMVDEEHESGGEGHSTNVSNLEERNKRVLGEEVMRGEGETGNTLEESEEDSKLLTIRYQGEEKEVAYLIPTFCPGFNCM